MAYALSFRANVAGPKVAVSTTRTCTASRGALVVEANKKGNKKSQAESRIQAVLTADIPGIGQKGELVKVQNGYLRNYLVPQRLGQPATEAILKDIQAQIAAAERAKAEVKAKAKAMATALSTIGVVKVAKKVGENDQIFGSVSATEVTDFIQQQTGRELDARKVTLPEIKTLGTYEASIKLHPEVTGFFKVKVEKLRQ